MKLRAHAWLLLVFCLPALPGLAQTFWNKTSIKTNLATLPVSLYSGQVEISLSPSISLVGTAFYRPEKALPFQDKLDNFIKTRVVGLTGVKFDYLYFNESKTGVKGFSPEVRWYLFPRKKHSFFVGAYGQYENFDLLIPASMIVPFNGGEVEVKAPVDFAINTMSGGILIGKNFRFSRHLGLDVVVIGGHYGRTTVVNGVVNDPLINRLNDYEKTLLKDKIIERFNVDPYYYDTNVGYAQASLKSIRQVPYFGLRGLGLNLSYYF